MVGGFAPMYYGRTDDDDHGPGLGASIPAGYTPSGGGGGFTTQGAGGGGVPAGVDPNTIGSETLPFGGFGPGSLNYIKFVKGYGAKVSFKGTGIQPRSATMKTIRGTVGEGYPVGSLFDTGLGSGSFVGFGAGMKAFTGRFAVRRASLSAPSTKVTKPIFSRPGVGLTIPKSFITPKKKEEDEEDTKPSLVIPGYTYPGLGDLSGGIGSWWDRNIGKPIRKFGRRNIPSWVRAPIRYLGAAQATMLTGGFLPAKITKKGFGLTASESRKWEIAQKVIRGTWVAAGAATGGMAIAGVGPFAPAPIAAAGSNVGIGSGVAYGGSGMAAGAGGGGALALSPAGYGGAGAMGAGMTPFAGSVSVPGFVSTAGTGGGGGVLSAIGGVAKTAAKGVWSSTKTALGLTAAQTGQELLLGGARDVINMALPMGPGPVQEVAMPAQWLDPTMYSEPGGSSSDGGQQYAPARVVKAGIGGPVAVGLALGIGYLLLKK